MHIHQLCIEAKERVKRQVRREKDEKLQQFGSWARLTPEWLSHGMNSQCWERYSLLFLSFESGDLCRGEAPLASHEERLQKSYLYPTAAAQYYAGGGQKSSLDQIAGSR